MTKEQLDLLDDENVQLERKISKLELFMDSEEFNLLSDLNKFLLIQQHSCMCNYSDLLHLRISLARK